MDRHIISYLLLLWSISHESFTNALVDEPKEQSWKNKNLTSVPVDLYMKLRRLDLANNFIRQLHTLGLPFLEQLDLSNNQLDLIFEGAFEKLALLEDLNLSGNSLRNNLDSNSKALKSLSRLKILDLSRNDLGDEAANRLLFNKSTLEQLKMTGNAMTKLTQNLFKESQSLTAITIDDNLISVIEQGTFEKLSQLEMLNLAKNNLPRICDFNLHQVKYLNLSSNSMEFFITHENERAYRLEILDLSYNKLLYFPIVPERSFLRYLYLQNNLVGTLSSEAKMVSEANSLYDEIIRKGDVRVTKNKLHSNWRQMPLIYIDLSFNYLTFVPLETLSVLVYLKTLILSHNCIQNIMWNVRNYSETGSQRQLYFHSLTYLDLGANGLSSISPLFLESLTQLETLNLQDNSVQPCASVDHLVSISKPSQMYSDTSCVTFGKLQNLKHLNLEENNIKTLPANSFQKTSLVYLNLAKNPNIAMEVGALNGVQKSLQSLTLSEINMTSSKLSLPFMPALTQLNMSNNNLHFIPNSLSLSPLREISIKDNAFVSFNHSLIFALSEHLDIMYISGNVFNCCDIEWLTMLDDLNITVPDINRTKCSTGDRNILIIEFLKSSMNCWFHKEVQRINFFHIIIIVVFIIVLLIVIIKFSRRAF